MPVPLRLLALPTGVLLSALMVAAPAAPAQEATRAAVASVASTRARTTTDVCGGEAAEAVAAARAVGVRADFLKGGTLTAKATSAGDRAIDLGAGTYRLADFLAGKQRLDSARVPAVAAGLIGLGSTRTTIALAPHTSTRAAAVPKVEYQVNPLNALRISSARARVGGFTLTGSAQGHTYNGLRIERSTDPRIADVKVVGIPGDMDRPPGETFGINDYRTVGARYEHVEVDGAGVGAAGFAANGSKDITVCAASSHDNPVSMGFAFWSVRDVTLIDCTAVDNGFSGFNFERVSGNVTLVRPVAQHNRWDMRVVSDQGTAKYTIVDPDLTHTQVPGKWTVELPPTYYQHPSLQKQSDVRLIVHGKSRPDLLRFVHPN